MKLGFTIAASHHHHQTRTHSSDQEDENFLAKIKKNASQHLRAPDVNAIRIAEARKKVQERLGITGTGDGIGEAEMPKVAAMKAISILKKMENQGFSGLESESVYGAAVAMPQIARSANWPGSLLALVIRTYLFLILNIVLQGFLLSMIGEYQLTWYAFGGQMHLCDFGASMKDCPDGPNCKGPLGTTYSAPRLYDYDIWATRIYVRDSLKAMFPEKEKEVIEKVDPGEYGMENYYCRFACLFLFMLSVVDDLSGTYKLAKTLWNIPTGHETWINYDCPYWAEKDQISEVKGVDELGFVQFNVAAMPWYWKLFNVVGVLVPKVLLWAALVRSGVHYLMETAGIVNCVVNAMALTFVLEMDEMVFNRFASSMTKHIMSCVQDLPNFSTEEEEGMTDEQALERFYNTEVGSARWSGKFLLILPIRFLSVLAIQVLFMWDYYRSNCVQHEDGSWVSQTMYLPAVLDYSPLRLMFGIEGQPEQEPFWTMPS